MKALIADMCATAAAHEHWASSLEASASEAATSTVFATQIRAWIETLERAIKAGAVDPHVDSTGKPSPRERKAL